METLKSSLDQSVNFIFDDIKAGKFESRFVQRTPEYFITYISSQSGCRQACRMCHLTATKQTQLHNANEVEFYTQAVPVFEHYKDLRNSNENYSPSLVHFNFMARGEPLANPIFIENNKEVLINYRNLALEHDLEAKYKISTILPSDIAVKGGLWELFKDSYYQGTIPEFYYSLYSVNPDFRKKWLPNAAPSEVGLLMLKEWQKKTNLIPKIHYAFIEGENDSLWDISEITKAISRLKLKVNFNIVRYNSYSEKYGKESSEEIIKRNARIISDRLEIDVKVVSRVGQDVSASCGMFYDKPKIKYVPNEDTLEAMKQFEPENFNRSIQESLRIIEGR